MGLCELRPSLGRACPWRIAETGMKPAPLPRSPWLDGNLIKGCGKGG